MTGWVPRQVVMHHSIEIVLKVHPFGKTVCGDQQPPLGIAEHLNLLPSLLRSEFACHDRNLDIVKLLSDVPSKVMRSRDIPAKDDRVESAFHQVREMIDKQLEFGIPSLTGQLLSLRDE